MPRKPPPPPPPLFSEGAAVLLAVALAAAAAIWYAGGAAKPAHRVLSLAAVLLTGGSLLLSAAEPGISTIDSFYLCSMVFTTVGYGDIAHPVSAAGRAVVIGLALGGIGFFSAAIEICGTLREAVDGRLIAGLNLRGRAAAYAVFAVNLAVGVVLCRALADDAELPKGALDAIYWSVVTSTSVGFGDHYPTTDVGKLAVCAYAFTTMAAAANVMDVAKEQLMALALSTPKRKAA